MSLDADGDVDMAVPQPVFQVAQAPRLSAWDQPSLISWVRQRSQYEATIRNRCAVTHEQYEHVITSIRNSIEPRILDHLACFVLKKMVAEVTDQDLGLAITRRCGTLQNNHIPDMDKLFQDQLKMDLRIEDTEARVLNDFVLFDQIVEDHGLGGILGSDRKNAANYEERMKLRCKYLMKNIAPEMLRLEMERLAIAKPVLKKDDIALYETLVERAREQQHYHMLTQEMKHGGKPRAQSKGSAASTKRPATTKSFLQQPAAPLGKRPDGAKTSKSGNKEADHPRSQPRDGCLFCNGTQWVRDRPTATAAEKDEALKRMNDLKNQRLSAKAVRSMVAPGDRPAILNGVLEVPFRADTGADYNVITRRILMKLKQLDTSVLVEKMSTPVQVEVADGRLVECMEKCEVDVQLLTAAGPVRLRKLSCIVLDGDTDESLVGDETLKSLGINVYQLLEQLAAKVEPEHDNDDIPEDDIVGTATPEEIMECINTMLENAEHAGFPKEHMAELGSVVKDAVDIWRTKLGADPPAKLEPLRVVLKDGTTLYRTKPRQYSAAKTKFPSEYGQQLEEFGLVVRNNQSRWACAVIPVRKKGPVEDFRCATDYRPANKCTIPIAGAMPSLPVVIERVKGACFFATFDLFKGFSQLLLHPDSREFFLVL